MSSSVLVTRPAGQAQALCASLSDAGFRPIHYPLIEIEALPRPSAQARQLLLQLDSFEQIIFVSSNAVRYGMAWIGDFWPQLPTTLHWYTVGAGSAAQLGDYGVQVQSPLASMNSEGLLALPGLQTVAGQRILIVKGQGGRDQLRQVLQQRGARVDELVAYRRRCPSPKRGDLFACIRGEACAALLLSSGEGLHNMVSLLQPEELKQLATLAVIVPGIRVAELAREAGFSRVMAAANASDEAMVAACSHYLGTEK